MEILLIDDNEDITEMLAISLNAYGHNCVTSNNGQEGLSLIVKKNLTVLKVGFFV